MASPEEIKQTLVFNEFHRTKRLPLNLIDFVNGANVRMIKSRRRLRLVNEALFGLIVAGQIRRQEFEGDKALEPGVLGFLPREITSLKSPWNPSVFYLTG